MAEPAPRLEVSPAGAAADYAPISGTAVASLIAAVAFVLVLGLSALFAAVSGDALHDVWFFGLPALSVVLAFVARKQIAAAEGTRTGVVYANAGWWVSVVVGVVYAAYLIGNQFTVRSDAQQQFTSFAEKVKAIDPNDPNNTAIYEACYMTMPPANRPRSSQDTETMDRAFGADLARFRQLDVIRIAARNPGQISFELDGMKDWEEGPRSIKCTLAYKMRTPEGEYDLLVPLTAAVANNQRDWQITPAQGGFITTAALTPYGWKVNQLEQSGQRVALEFLKRMSTGNPMEQQFAFAAFVRPGGDLPAAAKRFDAAAVQGRQALVGGLAFGGLFLPDYETVVGDPGFLTGFGGKPATDVQREQLRRAYDGGRISPINSMAVVSSETEPVLDLRGDAIEMTFPAMVELPGTAGRALVRVILRTTDPKEPAKLKAMRDRGGEPTKVIPPDVERDQTQWRVVRVESNLEPLPVPSAGPQGGG